MKLTHENISLWTLFNTSKHPRNGRYPCCSSEGTVETFVWVRSDMWSSVVMVSHVVHRTMDRALNGLRTSIGSFWFPWKCIFHCGFRNYQHGDHPSSAAGRTDRKSPENNQGWKMADGNESGLLVDRSRERTASGCEEGDDDWEEHVTAQWSYPTRWWM